MTRKLIDLSMEVYKEMMTYPNVAKPVMFWEGQRVTIPSSSACCP